MSTTYARAMDLLRELEADVPEARRALVIELREYVQRSESREALASVLSQVREAMDGSMAAKDRLSEELARWRPVVLPLMEAEADRTVSRTQWFEVLKQPHVWGPVNTALIVIAALLLGTGAVDVTSLLGATP